MSKNFRSGIRLQFALWATFALPCLAQQPAPNTNPPAQPADQSTQQGAANVQPQPKAQQPPPQEPYIIEDGGLSIEPIYWLNRAQPSVSGGAAATSFEGLAYPGHANPALGGELGIPAGQIQYPALFLFPRSRECELNVEPGCHSFQRRLQRGRLSHLELYDPKRQNFLGLPRLHLVQTQRQNPVEDPL